MESRNGSDQYHDERVYGAVKTGRKTGLSAGGTVGVKVLPVPVIAEGELRNLTRRPGCSGKVLMQWWLAEPLPDHNRSQGRFVKAVKEADRMLLKERKVMNDRIDRRKQQIPKSREEWTSMQSDFLAKVHTMYNQFTKAERKWLDFILQNPKRVLLCQLQNWRMNVRLVIPACSASAGPWE